MKVLNFLIFVLFSLNSLSATISEPLLWKIEKDDRESYIFGTFHIGVSIDDFSEQLKKIVEESDIFVMETDLSKVDQNMTLERATYPEGQSLKSYLPKESWQKLVAALSPILPEEQIGQFKPWYLNLLVSHIALGELGLVGSLDIDLKSFAKEKELNLGYLEEPTLQFSVLEAITPVTVFDSGLKKSEGMVSSLKTSLSELYQCYKVSDIKCIASKMGTSKEGGSIEPWQRDLMLVQRNKTWIPEMEKHMARGTTFFAVGSGHLVGDGNVLELLKAEGYSLSRVRFK